jgi:hypothetical protein
MILRRVLERFQQESDIDRSDHGGVGVCLRSACDADRERLLQYD